jgi:tetratricopeptide (TPR) repeat protein/predicted MPP superfamily phosphohydrolase
MEKVIYSWVHLSDIHINHGTAHDQLDQILVLEKLRQDIIDSKTRGISSINAIYVTGDIASTGDNKQTNSIVTDGEYAKANLWLSDLSSAIGLTKRDIYVIPGNHDYQLISVNDNRNLDRLIEKLRDCRESIDNVLSHQVDKELILARLKNYMSFACNFSPYCHVDDKESAGIYWQHKLTLPDGINVRLIGVNTALLTMGKDDYKKLQLGNYPLTSFIATEPIRANEIVVVLSHHPFEWLNDEANVHAWIKSNCHLHLCGHIHNPETEKQRSGSGGEYIRIVSGAAHSGSGSLIGHGYCVCEFILCDKILKLRVWPRKWSDKNKDFRRDVDNIPDSADYVDYNINNLITDKIASDNLQDSKCGVFKLPSQGESATSTLPVSIIIHKPNVPACDSPPTSPAWVGREAELDLFNDNSIKVFAVTGIGGQGKSALVARHIENMISSETSILWDWRDCKEEGDTLQTHLLSIIERVTSGKLDGGAFKDEDVAAVVDYLFKVLSDFEGFFVFDNIDRYIDASVSKPIHGMKLLIEQAIVKQHKSHFVFTCRPSMKYDDPQFFEIGLSGLSVTDTQRLFELRGVMLDQQIKRQIAEANMLTQGHPLWLNLLATQVAKNKSTLNNLISDIKNGKNVGLPATIIGAIWKTLNDKQKTVLRCMAETVRPETEDQLAIYVSSYLQFNQFSKALRSLKTLALVVIKTAPNTPDTLELHPLVKTFIRCEFTKSERICYIDSIARYFDRIISKYIKSIVHGASFCMLEHWIYRTELAINAAKYVDALKAIKDVTEPLLGAGHSEEFVRITKRLFSEINFTDAVLNEYLYFDEVFYDFIEVLSQLGQYDEAEAFLMKYDATVVGKSARYVNLCNMNCFLYWSKNDYPLSIDWGKKGADFVASTNIDTRFNPYHNLALAQRDFGDIDSALKYFLKEHVLSDVLGSELIKDRNGSFYGNIGRCLFLKGDIDDALNCYKKSLNLLLNEEMQHKTTPMNIGWGHYWIGEVLEAKKEYLVAWSFYSKAATEWKNVSPPKAQLAINRAMRICELYPALINADNKDDRIIANACITFLKA